MFEVLSFIGSVVSVSLI